MAAEGREGVKQDRKVRMSFPDGANPAMEEEHFSEGEDLIHVVNTHSTPILRLRDAPKRVG